MRAAWISVVSAVMLLLVLVSPAIAQPLAAPPVAGNEALPLSLTQAFDRLRESNRAVRQARLRLDVATAEIGRVDVRPNPSLTAQIAQAEPNRYRPGATDRLLRIDQLVERGGKRELRAQQARLLEDAARWELADVMRTQTVAVAEAYFDLLAAQELARLAAENLAGYGRLLSAAQRRVAAGDLAAVDASRLRVEAGRAANEDRAARAQVDLAQLALAALIGAEPSAPRLLAADPLPDRREIDDTRELLLNRSQSPALSDARRADLLAAQARLAASDQALDLARSLRTRDVSVGLQAERPAALGGHVVGISATIPLLLNNSYSGDIARALAERESAADDLLRLQAQMRSETERAAAQIRSTADRAMRLIDQTLADSDLVVKGLEFAFARGAATLTDLFDARRQHAAVRSDSIAARSEFAKALAAWRAATRAEPTEANGPADTMRTPR